MGIPFHTTTIAVGKTQGEIYEVLAAHGARSITIEYDASRVPAGIVFVSREQAARTAFRILLGFIQALSAIIEAGMATLDQVLFGYLEHGGTTVYEVYVQHERLLPAHV